MRNDRAGQRSTVWRSAGAWVAAVISSWATASVANPIERGRATTHHEPPRPFVELRLNEGLVRIDGHRVGRIEVEVDRYDPEVQRTLPPLGTQLLGSGRMEFVAPGAERPIVATYRVDGGRLRLSFGRSDGAVIDGTRRNFPTEVVIGDEPRRLAVIGSRSGISPGVSAEFRFTSLATPAHVAAPEPPPSELEATARRWFQGLEPDNGSEAYDRLEIDLRTMGAPSIAWQWLDHRAIARVERGAQTLISCRALALLRQRSPWYAAHPAVVKAFAENCADGRSGFTDLSRE